MRSSYKVIKTARLSERPRDIPVPEEQASEEAESPNCDAPTQPENVAEGEASEEETREAVAPSEPSAPPPEAFVPPQTVPSPEEIERLRAQAREAGWQEGFAAGRQEAAQLIAILQNIVNEAIAARAEFIAIATPQLLNLAVQIAEKIIRREVETDPTVAQRIAEEALRQAVDKHHLRIRVHPEDLATLQAIAPELRAALDDVREFEIVPDRRSGHRRMARGGCLIETESGVIDARIETQLEEIREQLMEAGSDGQLVNESMGARVN